jgi:hypothetical protein
LIKKGLLACLLLFLSPTVFAQAVPSAEGSGRSIWVGVEGSTFNPDWGCNENSPFSCWDSQLLGIAVFSDANHLVGKIGLEGEMRWLNWRGPGTTQSNYLVGPRYPVFNGRKLSANVKFVSGIAFFHSGGSSDLWAAFVPGGTIGYRVSPRFLIRADYEYQMWPGFVGKLGQHGLTPNGFSVGASYRLFR